MVEERVGGVREDGWDGEALGIGKEKS